MGKKTNRLVIATNNRGKIKEFSELLQALNITVKTLDYFPSFKLVEETGQTFAENACLKAGSVAAKYGLPALGDDSGLEVDFLNGAPGVYSARFAGKLAGDKCNNNKLLALLENVPWEQRTARFRCVAALVDSNGKVNYGEGVLEGLITFEPRGDQGFGYDPLFLLPEYGKTLAELGAGIKNKLSHRARAVQDLWPALQEMFTKR